MMADKLKDRLLDMVTHITFEYQGIDCGIDPLSPTHFDIWCGDDTITVDNITAVMDTPLFNGRALKDIAQEITIIDW